MGKYTDICNAIVSIVNTVAGIGKVYDQAVIATTIKDLKERGTKDDKINVLTFAQVARKTESSEAFKNEKTTRYFTFNFAYSYSFEENSDRIFGEMLEDLADKFNSNQTLNGTVKTHTKIEVVSNQPEKFSDVLCNFAVLKLETTENKF